MENSSESSSNSSITFRLKDRTIDDLKKQSEEEGVSLNNLVNKVLASYLEWECVAPKVGFVSIQKSVQSFLIVCLKNG